MVTGSDCAYEFFVIHGSYSVAWRIRLVDLDSAGLAICIAAIRGESRDIRKGYWIQFVAVQLGRG